MKLNLILLTVCLIAIICKANAGKKGGLMDMLKGGALMAMLSPRMLPLPLPMPIPMPMMTDTHHHTPVHMPCPEPVHVHSSYGHMSSDHW